MRFHWISQNTIVTVLNVLYINNLAIYAAAALLTAALRTHGAAGPSGLDAYGWRCLCTSFQRASDDLGFGHP